MASVNLGDYPVGITTLGDREYQRYPNSGCGLMNASFIPLETRPVQSQSVDLDSLAEKLWEKLYKRPVIIACIYCSSHNAIDNPTCVQCGAPMGDSVRD